MEQPEEVNPWISIWTEPRVTMRQILNRDSTLLVLILAGLVGIAEALIRNPALAYGIAYSSIERFMVLVVIAAVLGVLVLYVGAYLTRWTGGWLGGTATLVSIRTAYAWSSLPKILSAIVLLASWGAAGLMPGPIAGLDDAVMLLIITLAVWGVVLHCHCLGEVQGFSAWKGLANSILALLIGIVPIVLLIWLLGRFGFFKMLG